MHKKVCHDYYMETTKICKICHITKNVTEFPKAGTYKGEPSYRGECKECNQHKQRTTPANKEAQKKYKTSSKGKATRAERRNRPEVKAKEREYERSPAGRKSARERKKRLYYSDPLYNLKVRLRARFRNSLNAKNLDKQESVANLIGMP